MKPGNLAILILAGSWVCSVVSGAGEKYIKVDPATGKPEYASKEEAQKFKGMADDKDLCSIVLKPVKITKVVKGEGEATTTEEVDGFSFDCAPSKECDDKNKEVNAAKKTLIDKIAAEEKIINPPEKSKEEKEKEAAADKKKSAAEKKAEKAAEKTKKGAAIKEKGKLEAKLAKFKPDCGLKFYADAGGDDTTTKTQLTPDEIKAKKILYAVCLCQKLDMPPP